MRTAILIAALAFLPAGLVGGQPLTVDHHQLLFLSAPCAGVFEPVHNARTHPATIVNVRRRPMADQ